MGKQNINNIIKSELVAKTNNARIRHEYGDLDDPNVTLDDSGRIVFTTQYEIEKIIFVTERGIVQIEGIHYEVVDNHTIRFAAGSTNKNVVPFVLVAYEFNKSSFINLEVIPVIEFFDITPFSGADNILYFSFSIRGNSGKDIVWSILKDGGSTPIVSGDTLTSNKDVTTNISYTEAIDRQGETIPFTLIVTYNTESTNKNEKLLATASYKLNALVPMTGTVRTSPSSTNIAGEHPYKVYYTIYNPGNTSIYKWSLDKILPNGQTINMVPGSGDNGINGDQSDVPTGFLQESYTSAAGEKTTITYRLSIMENNSGSWQTMPDAYFKVNVPAPTSTGASGYIGVDIMQPLGDAITDPLLSPQDQYSRYITRIAGNEALLSQQITSINSVTPVDVDPIPSATLNTAEPVYLVISLDSILAPNGITILSSLGSNINALYSELLGPNGEKVYIYTHTNPIEMPTNVAPVKILKN